MTARNIRRVVRGLGGLVLGTVFLVAIELRLAGMWPRLPWPDFDLDGPIGPADGRPRLGVVWLGDSAVAGEGASDASRTLPHLVAMGLGRPVEMTVLAQPRAKVADVLRDQAPRVAALGPDIVFVSVGGNDASHLNTRGRFLRQYRQLVGALPAGVPLVLLGVPDMGAAIPRRIQPMRAFAEWRGFRLDAAVRLVAREVGATYVNIAVRTGHLFRRQRHRLYAPDRYHPGDAGYRAWARAVLDRLGEAGVPGAVPAPAATGPRP
jgi:lysophospholipase L1-like esterase